MEKSKQSFREIRELARKADEAKGKEREKFVEELVERLEYYSIIEDIGWTRIQNARKIAKLFKPVTKDGP